MSTLEERIAAALSDDIASSDVAALIAETEKVITTADATAEQERMRALDPVASPDAAKARAAMEDAAFTRDRLRTVLPRLHARLKEVEAAEYLARWKPAYERVKADRDALAAEMREVYPAAVAKLVNLFQRMAESDREVLADKRVCALWRPPSAPESGANRTRCRRLAATGRLDR